MMKICERGINFVQIINAEGDVRICGWLKDCIIGNLIDDDMKTIMHSERAKELRKPLLDGTYSNCLKDNCPYLSNNDMERHLIELEEVPDYPQAIYLAYEGVCNYSCTCCSSYQHMLETKQEDKSGKYDLLEKRIKEFLPYVRTVGANGRGELFASKRILKLLSEWRPLSPKEEISVYLETNGSMFDKKHWQQIENLGQYNLSVVITIMSFDESIYQYLSGTKLPINRLEENLRFVKKLREAQVINYLELATVLQEANFREMPDFIKRCIEEFGADKVRIRPIMPSESEDKNIQWFMDVRNPKHPYYEDYCKVIRQPIFQDSHVLLWSNDLPSSRGEHPGIKREMMQKLADKILDSDDFTNVLRKMSGENNLTSVSIYGIGTIGKLIIRVLEGKMRVASVYDSYSSEDNWHGVPVKRTSEVDNEENVIFVTVYDEFPDVCKSLRKYGYKGRIVDIWNLLCNR